MSDSRISRGKKIQTTGCAEKIVALSLPPLLKKQMALAHGVTVAQQILVLFVRVRILVSQPENKKPLAADRLRGVFY